VGAGSDLVSVARWRRFWFLQLPQVNMAAAEALGEGPAHCTISSPVS
jgi:hypothetical protein